MTQGLDTEVSGWLSEMADLEAGIDALRFQMEDEIAEIYPVELMAQVDLVRLRYEQDQKQTQARIAELKEKVKAGVLLLGRSVRGVGAQAIWIKPRVSWDTRALAGYAAAHPEIERFRKVGKPSVSIRRSRRAG
jgi:hypothetical protein